MPCCFTWIPACAGMTSLGGAAASSRCAMILGGLQREILVWRCVGESLDQPESGLADAVVTLVSNMAARQRRRIEFRPEWFDVASDAAPERV